MLSLALGTHAAFSPLAPLLLAAAAASSPFPENPELVTLGEGMGFLEGPVWLDSESRLIFSDIPASKLMQWTEARGVQDWISSEGSNGNVLDQKGRIVSCQQAARNLVRRDPRTGEILEVIAEKVDGLRLNSPNDVAVLPSGSLWFTDPPWGLPRQREGREMPGHFVFFHDAVAGETSAVFKDFCMPNGIALSPDQRILLVTDTGAHPAHPDPKIRQLSPSVSAFALTTDGHLAAPEALWSVPVRSDGMCVDSFGRIYMTSSPGVTVWGPRGTKLAELSVPNSTTNVCLGGQEGHTLFITAGPALFAVEVSATPLVAREAR